MDVSSVATAFVLLLVPLIAVESCALVTSPGGLVALPPSNNSPNYFLATAPLTVISSKT